MPRKYLFIVILIIVVVVAGAIWYKMSPNSMISVFSPEQAEKGEGLPAGTTGGAFPTRKEAPKNVTVPEPGATNQNAEVAIPKTSVQAAPGVSAKLRTFEIVAAAGKYTPSTIIVRTGDTVHINFKAEDDTYDIVFPDYGLYQQAKKGETKIVEFQATTDGQFTFYCENSCPKGKMQGTLIVAP